MQNIIVPKTNRNPLEGDVIEEDVISIYNLIGI